jgi:TolB-like protein
MGGLGIVVSPSHENLGEQSVLGSAETSQAVVDQLERILRSDTFMRSRRLGRFLRFTVEQTLAGRQAAVKEYLVGVEVFGKTESFDPRIDSIVRVEARRLRAKLEQYYQTEGTEDVIIIQFPKGSYVPLILHRDQLPQLQQARSASERHSIGVVPFTNRDPGSGDHGFCSGLTEDVIGALTKTAGFRVVARAGEDGHDASNGSRPGLLLEGSVRRDGNRVRVTAQLIDVEKGEYVWCETYDRDATDVFALQEELSRAIVSDFAQRG